jgi:predicted GIY-YIG superfamily endonuclease
MPTLSRSYYIYIMTNQSDTLDTGVTNELTKRVYQYKNKLFPALPPNTTLHDLFISRRQTMFKQRWRKRSRSKDG